MSLVTHLESAIDGTELDHRQIQTVHADRPLWVRYDLEAAGRTLTKDSLEQRPPTMWRYRELLPLDDPERAATLGETMTPLVPCGRLGREFGLSQLFVKDESRLPTGSFKARGLAMAVNRAKELGVSRVAIPTAGNAGGAAAAYGARAGLRVDVFMPADTPIVNQHEVPFYGAAGHLVDGLIDECGRIVRQGVEHVGWLDLSTLREPYRIEGKKTMGFELAEQMNWSLPDVVLYPTGGGTGLLGMWKAFDELESLGFIDSRRPRLYACQAAGCAPIVRAFEAGDRFAEPIENPTTAASGIRVPAAIGDFMILDALRESKGRAIACAEDSLLAWAHRGASLEGLSIAPETGACLDALDQLVEHGEVRSDETVVVFNTGAAQKYIEVMERQPLPSVALPFDWKTVTD